MFLSLVVAAAGAGIGSSSSWEKQMREACRTETHRIPSLGDCSAVTALFDASTYTDAGYETPSRTFIVCANSTTDVMGNTVVKTDYEDVIDNTLDAGECRAPYTGEAYYLNAFHYNIARHISGVSVGKTGVKACSLIVGTTSTEPTYKDSVQDASGNVLKGPDVFYNLDDDGASLGAKMIVESEYVCDKSVLLVTTDAWTYEQLIADGWKRTLLNSFSDASGNYVPQKGKYGTKDVIWQYTSAFDWSIDVLSSDKKGWQNVCTQKKSTKATVPNPHAIDASVESDVIAFVSYDPSKDESAMLYISSLKGVSNSDCCSSADMVKVPLEKQQDCHQLESSTERADLKKDDERAPTFKEVCAAGYFVDISDDGSFVRVGLNYDRVLKENVPKAMLSLYTVSLSSHGNLVTTTAKSTTTAKKEDGYRHRRETSSDSISTSPLVAIEDWLEYYAPTKDGSTQRYEIPGYIEGTNANFVSSSDMHVVAYLNGDGKLRVHEVGVKDKVCKMTCAAAECPEGTEDPDDLVVLPDAMVTNVKNHVLYVRQNSKAITSYEDVNADRAWSIDLSKDGNFVSQADGETPCTFFVKRHYVLDFVRSEPSS